MFAVIKMVEKLIAEEVKRDDVEGEGNLLAAIYTALQLGNNVEQVYKIVSGTFEKEIGALHEKISMMQIKIDTMQVRIDTMQVRINTLEVRINTLEVQNVKVKESIQDIGGQFKIQGTAIIESADKMMRDLGPAAHHVIYGSMDKD